MPYSYPRGREVPEKLPNVEYYEKPDKENGTSYQLALLERRLNDPDLQEAMPPELRGQLEEIRARILSVAFIYPPYLPEVHYIMWEIIRPFEFPSPGTNCSYSTVSWALDLPYFVMDETGNAPDALKTMEAYHSFWGAKTPRATIGKTFQERPVLHPKEAFLTEANPFTGRPLTKNTPDYERIKALPPMGRRTIGYARYLLGQEGISERLADDFLTFYLNPDALGAEGRKEVERHVYALNEDIRNPERIFYLGSFWDTLGFDPLTHTLRPQIGKLHDSQLDFENDRHRRLSIR